MKTRSWTGPIVLLAAALLVGACSSGTDAAQTSTSAATTSSAASATGSSAATPSTGASSSSAPSTADSSRLVTGTTSVPLSSRSSRPAPTSPSPSGTAAVGAFPAQTVRFFSALCSGLAVRPADKLDQLTGDVDAQRAAAAQLFQQQSSGLLGAVTVMRSNGVPAIPDGDRLAAAVLKTYPQMAAAARRGAVAIAQSSGASGLATSIEQARQLTTDAAAPLDAVSDIIGAPAVVSRLRQIPSCASVLRN